MLFSTFALFPALLSFLGADQPRPRAASIVVQEQLTIRIPVVRARPIIPVRWIERKGPRCIPSREVLAATLKDGRTVDFHLRDRRRVRAQMDGNCPALDFYGGFYLQPEDGRICADRDEIRDRVGGSCPIERFRLMVPRRVK